MNQKFLTYLNCTFITVLIVSIIFLIYFNAAGPFVTNYTFIRIISFSIIFSGSMISLAILNNKKG